MVEITEVHNLLIIDTKKLAEKFVVVVEDHKNLNLIKGNEELKQKLKDLFSDFAEHEDKLRLTISTSEYVYRNLKSLETTMNEVNKFLEVLTQSRTLMFSKKKLKIKLQNLLHALRAKNTQLLTSVTLELLSRSPKGIITDNAKFINTVEFDMGFAYFYGIGRPKNLTLAVENFNEVICN